MAKAKSELFEPVRFLIVDDEDDLREILIEQLAELRIQVKGVFYRPEFEGARNGKEGLEKASRKWFDVILTDISMPEMNGIDMLAGIRGHGSDVPVVMLTGYGDKEKSVQALRLGSYGFLDKPWRADYLRRVMTGAAELGIGMRAVDAAVETRVAKFEGVPDSRRRQLRTVFRSILIGGDGLHRQDVCEIPDRPRETVKKIG